MKKILLIVLALALVPSLCVGCNNNRVIRDDDFDDEPVSIAIGGVPDEKPDDPVVEEPNDPGVEEPDDPVVEEPEDPVVEEPDDPVVEWPSVLPPFEEREGEVESIELREDGTYIIKINNTARYYAQQYARTARSKYGWEIINWKEEDPTTTQIRKDTYWAAITIRESIAEITLETWHVWERLPEVWPTDRLPQGFPEYTNGVINEVAAYVAITQKAVDLMIDIKGSSKGSIEKYLPALEDAGWKVGYIGNERFITYSDYYRSNESWTFEKDGVSGVIDFLPNEGKLVSIQIFK